MAEYIEKKKLVNRLKMWLMDLENDMDKGDYGELCENKGAREAVESCICEVEEQPIADVQPIRRGRWIDACCEIECSCCNTRYHDDIINMCYDWSNDKINYCPNCGARMDGEVE